MIRLFNNLRIPLAIAVVAFGTAIYGCGSGSGVQQTDGTPAHAPAATEAEALQRCAKMRPERQKECIDFVKNRFHDTSN
ncbi:MAG: hypothetical protein P4L46_07810 [Fimbriimonas sp.]|nr:hypothetical protein [Fimbriimonas sp.]